MLLRTKTVLNLPRYTHAFLKVVESQLSIWAKTPGENLSFVIQGQCVWLSTWHRHNDLCIQSYDMFWQETKREWFMGWGHQAREIMTKEKTSYCPPGFFLGFSWPSCPKSLQPQVYTVPSSSRKTVCLRPQPTSQTFFPSKNSHFLGSTTISSSIPPKPNCP